MTPGVASTTAVSLRNPLAGVGGAARSGVAEHRPEEADEGEAQWQIDAYWDQLGAYPDLAEVVGGQVAKAGYDYATEFLFGLDLILDGLDRLRQSPATPGTTR